MVDEVDLGGEFFRLLVQFDERIMQRVAAEGCRRCDGPLHRGDYNRKPRGALIAPVGEAFVVRFSLCCGREGCRRRATPPSLRFWAASSSRSAGPQRRREPDGRASGPGRRRSGFYLAMR